MSLPQVPAEEMDLFDRFEGWFASKKDLSKEITPRGVMLGARVPLLGETKETSSLCVPFERETARRTLEVMGRTCCDSDVFNTERGT